VCVFVDAFHFFSTGLLDAYYNSWVFIIKPQWSRTNYSYFSNIHNTGLCFFAVVAGCIMYLTKRYKTLQMVGLVIRLIGEGINFMTVNGNQNDATFIMARILISCGAGFIVTTTAVAAPASAPHTDLAGAMCVLHMFAQVAGSIAGSIAASVWNSSVPRNLKKYLPELTDKQRTTMFGSIGAAQRQLPHEAVNRAYTEAMRPLLAVAIATTGVALILSWWTVEIPLGRSHNIVETHKVVRVRGKFEVADEVVRKNADQAEAAALARVQRDQKQ
jgi:MFS family permease